MLRNYLAAALRNLVRNKLYAAINIIGLAVGFAAAVLIALYVRDEFSYDTWIPGYKNVYRVSFALDLPGMGADPWDFTPGHVGPWLKLDFHEIQAVARLSHPHDDGQLSLRHGETEGAEFVYWADPSFAQVLPLPTIAGDFAQALSDPAGIVLTRRMARKYFGRDDPIGETIELDRQHPLTVDAVLEDLPSNTHLAAEVIASSLASFSELARIDAASGPQTGQTYTYLRFAPGVSVDSVAKELPDFLDRRLPPPRSAGVPTAHLISSLELLPLADIHLHPAGLGAMKPAGNPEVVYALAGIAALLGAVAAINFINLMTARASRRAVEVGVRKVMGARRIHLIVQFLAESLIYAVVAMSAAIILARGLLPALNGLSAKAIAAARLFDPALLCTVGALTLVVGVVAGLYPAFVLSSFQPSRVLSFLRSQSRGFGRLRQVLVTGQFAVLIALILSTGVIYRQTAFAIDRSMRFGHDQVLVIETACGQALRDEIGRIAGVVEAACAGGFLQGFDVGGVMGRTPDGKSLSFLVNYVDLDFFHLYGIGPLAGRLFDSGHSVDLLPPAPGPSGGSAIINESAARHLGFSSPQEAVGRPLPVMKREIVGVVPDFQMKSMRDAVQPTFYLPGDPEHFKFLTLRLSGQHIPDALRTIDEAWGKLGDKQRPITRFFDQYVNDLYAEFMRQGELLTVLASIAIFIAALGLFGLSAFTAETRTKEIGIRKALGATRGDILRLLLWEFAKPVLWANAIAWPVAYIVMQRWLQGFAYHVGLEPWIFVAASALALVIALVTVSGHAILVARAQPVAALRYE